MQVTSFTHASLRSTALFPVWWKINFRLVIRLNETVSSGAGLHKVQNLKKERRRRHGTLKLLIISKFPSPTSVVPSIVCWSYECVTTGSVTPHPTIDDSTWSFASPSPSESSPRLKLSNIPPAGDVPFELACPVNLAGILWTCRVLTFRILTNSITLKILMALLIVCAWNSQFEVSILTRANGFFRACVDMSCT